MVIAMDIEPLSQKNNNATNHDNPLEGRRKVDLGIVDYIAQLSALKERIGILETELNHLTRDFLESRGVVREIQASQVEIKIEIRAIKQQTQATETLLKGMSESLDRHMEEEGKDRTKLLFWVITTLLAVVGSIATIFLNRVVV